MAAAWILAAALAALPSAALPAGRGPEWRETLTPHFRVKHESAWLPQGLTMGLEHIAFRLNMDLGLFTDWSARGRANVYLYQDMRSYVNGEFSPPAWSNGIAVCDRNTVAIPAMRETSSMLRVLAHENTHLIFVKYFRAGRSDPPSWINEGLAMLEEEDSREKPELSQWYQSMVAMDPRRWFPLERFFALSPTRDLRDGDKNQVTTFYVQAYSVTHFLLRRHSRLQFKAFCDALRGGKSAADALRVAYHFRDVRTFEENWRAWLADPSHRRRVEALSIAQRTHGDSVIDEAGRSAPFPELSGSRAGGSAALFAPLSADR